MYIEVLVLYIGGVGWSLALCPECWGNPRDKARGVFQSNTNKKATQD